jgi:adenylate kinase family enzyme
MRRVYVVGTSGAGKSTLASRLAAILNVPHVELDALHWEPNWVEAEPEVFRRRVRTAVAGDAWVVDGNYRVMQGEFWDRVDTLVWLNYSFPTILARSLRRTTRRIVRREPCCNGNQESLARALSRDSIVLWVVRTYLRRRRQHSGLARAATDSGRRVVELRTPAEAERWIERLAKSSSDPASVGRSASV